MKSVVEQNKQTRREQQAIDTLIQSRASYREGEGLFNSVYVRAYCYKALRSQTGAVCSQTLDDMVQDAYLLYHVNGYSDRGCAYITCKRYFRKHGRLQKLGRTVDRDTVLDQQVSYRLPEFLFDLANDRLEQIARHLANGFSQSEIAGKLGISQQMVSKLCHEIAEKLSAGDMLPAVRKTAPLTADRTAFTRPSGDSGPSDILAGNSQRELLFTLAGGIASTRQRVGSVVATATTEDTKHIGYLPHVGI